MGNQLIAPSSDSTAPVAPGKRDVANRTLVAPNVRLDARRRRFPPLRKVSGVPNVGPEARSVDAACCPEEPPVNASDEESGRLYQTPDLFSLTSSRDSAYGTARTVLIAPRGPEKLQTNTEKDVMEDMDETIAPSRTVDPSKVTDNSDDAVSYFGERRRRFRRSSAHTKESFVSSAGLCVPKID